MSRWQNREEKCPNPECDGLNMVSDNYCGECGFKLAIECPNCKKIVRLSRVFCGNCHKKLPNTASEHQLGLSAKEVSHSSKDDSYGLSCCCDGRDGDYVVSVQAIRNHLGIQSALVIMGLKNGDLITMDGRTWPVDRNNCLSISTDAAGSLLFRVRFAGFWRNVNFHINGTEQGIDKNLELFGAEPRYQELSHRFWENLRLNFRVFRGFYQDRRKYHLRRNKK